MKAVNCPYSYFQWTQTLFTMISSQPTLIMGLLKSERAAEERVTDRWARCVVISPHRLPRAIYMYCLSTQQNAFTW